MKAFQLTQMSQPRRKQIPVWGRSCLGARKIDLKDFLFPAINDNSGSLGLGIGIGMAYVPAKCGSLGLGIGTAYVLQSAEV